MLLRDFQNLLGHVYGIDLSANVYDFLVTDPSLLKYWGGAADEYEREEKLLLLQEEDELGLALYLHPDLLTRLSKLDPRAELSDANLSDFCTVLEGVSHFNYMAWNAAAEKRVTLMELETQAELDKYVGARVLLETQPESKLGASLYARLFDNPRFHDDLGVEELSRYRNASDFAGRYCRSLELRYTRHRVGRRMTRELRTFFRLLQPAKVSHIHSATFA